MFCAIWMHYRWGVNGWTGILRKGDDQNGSIMVTEDISFIRYYLASSIIIMFNPLPLFMFTKECCTVASTSYKFRSARVLQSLFSSLTWFWIKFFFSSFIRLFICRGCACYAILIYTTSIYNMRCVYINDMLPWKRLLFFPPRNIDISLRSTRWKIDYFLWQKSLPNTYFEEFSFIWNSILFDVQWLASGN